MKKEILYKYLGTNGIILSPVHLEDTYYVRYIRLTANPGYKLTKDFENYVFSTTFPEDNNEEWIEVEDIGQN